MFSHFQEEPPQSCLLPFALPPHWPSLVVPPPHSADTSYWSPTYNWIICIVRVYLKCEELWWRVCRGGRWRAVAGRDAPRCWVAPQKVIEIFLHLYFALNGLKPSSKIFAVALHTCGTHHPPSATLLQSWDHTLICSIQELIKTN